MKTLLIIAILLSTNAFSKGLIFNGFWSGEGVEIDGDNTTHCKVDWIQIKAKNRKSKKRLSLAGGSSCMSIEANYSTSLRTRNASFQFSKKSVFVIGHYNSSNLEEVYLEKVNNDELILQYIVRGSGVKGIYKLERRNSNVDRSAFSIKNLNGHWRGKGLITNTITGETQKCIEDGFKLNVAKDSIEQKLLNIDDYSHQRCVNQGFIRHLDDFCVIYKKNKDLFTFTQKCPDGDEGETYRYKYSDNKLFIIIKSGQSDYVSEFVLERFHND